MDYETKEEARAQQSDVEPLMNEITIDLSIAKKEQSG
jgi:hypothetical protein